LRRTVAQAYGHRPGGGSLSVTAALVDDVSWRGTAAPIGQWAKEAWSAANRPMEERSRHLRLTWLRSAWTALSRSPPTSWQEVRGPFGAIWLSLARLRWTWCSPFVFVDDLGFERKVLEQSPKLILEEARASYLRRLDQMAAATLGATLPISFDIHRRILQRSISPFSFTDKALIVAGLSGRAWTKKMLCDRGLADSPLCSCGQEDTLLHRWWSCPLLQEVREHTVSEETLAALADTTFEERNVLLRSGLLPDQSPLARPLHKDNNFIFWAQDGSETPRQQHFSGRVFTDGSCFKGPSVSFSRAGGSVVSLLPDGGLRAAICGPVWAGLPQTSQAAENVAFAAATELSMPGSKVFIDYKGLVSNLTEPWREILHHNKKYSGFLRSAMRNLAWGKLDIRWVRAHQDLRQQFATEEDRHQAVGNNLADEWAKKGANIHQEAPPTDFNRAEAEAKAIQDIFCIIAGTAKASFADPALNIKVSKKEWLARRRARRAADGGRRPPPGPSVRRLPPHQWVFGQEAWHCLHCGRKAASYRRRVRYDDAGCGGRRQIIEELVSDHRGHKLFLFHLDGSGLPLLSCKACGAWTTVKPRKLLDRCTGTQTISGRRDHKQIWDESRHPHKPQIRLGRGIPLHSG